MDEQLIVIRKNAKTPEGYKRIDVTSWNKKLCRYLSPFYLGPIAAPDGLISKNMENLWQFSKVYEDMVDENQNPTDDFFEWRKGGFEDSRAHRHPHSGVPLYAWWDGQKLGYIEARKKIYIPSYISCVKNNPQGFEMIKSMLGNGEKIALADFDAYNFKARGMTYKDVVNNSSMIMGHGFVLAMMLEDVDVDKIIK